jgi:hypothetical protein
MLASLSKGPCAVGGRGAAILCQFHNALLRPVVSSSARSFGRHPKHDPRIIPPDKPVPRCICRFGSSVFAFAGCLAVS